MVEEKYYLVERVRDCFRIDAANMNIVKQTGKKLEMLSSEKIKPKEIGIKLNENGKIFCDDDKYKLKEINKKESSKILKDMKSNYSLWQEFMTNPSDLPSPHLGDPLNRIY